jgi:lipoprotein-releasing system ATP-binding protein
VTGILLQLEAIRRVYKSGDDALIILDGASLTLHSGETVALLAQSGSGKSTLLHLSGLLEKPDGGRVIIDGRDVGELSDNARSEIRLRKIGFVYQFHHLLAEFTAIENVTIPQMIAGVPEAVANKRSIELLEKFGLAGSAMRPPGKLSGGEQQRVAIARALANRPMLLLADEPTGNLDVGIANIVFDELLRVVQSENVAMLVATHNPSLAARMDRQVTLRNGRIVSDTLP